MAIFIPNQTTCVLCGGIISSRGEAVSFPAFIPPGHELSDFSDSAFHRDCFASWEHRDELQYLYDRYREIWETRPGNRKSLEDIEVWGKGAFEELFSRGMTL